MTAMPLLHSSTVTDSVVVHNLPVGGEVLINTDADLSVEFFDPETKSYFSPVSVPAPGGYLGTPSARAKITASSSTKIRIVSDATH